MTPSREYLFRLAAGPVSRGEAARPLQQLIDSTALLITTGFLPQRFADEMCLCRWMRRSAPVRPIVAECEWSTTSYRVRPEVPVQTCFSVIWTGGPEPDVCWSIATDRLRFGAPDRFAGCDH